MVKKHTGKLFRVAFKDTGVVGIVEQGATVFDAAKKAGVYINSLCGGDGLCGKCRVNVEDGRVTMRSNTFLEDNEVEQGEVVACLAQIESDIIVSIPEESSLQSRPAFDEEETEELHAEFGGKERYPINPLYQKRRLELPHPSIDDNLSDYERLKRELSRKSGISIASAELSALRRLPHILRKSDYKVMTTAVFRDVDFELIDVDENDGEPRNYGVACDIGTTTIMAYLVDLDTGRICGSAAVYNAQMHYGEDVISRIVYIQENSNGLNELNGLVVGDINSLIETLSVRFGIQQDSIGYIVCTGNTIMTHILLGITPEYIRREPYIPVVATPSMVPARDIGISINDSGYAGFLPSLGAFVGSDISAAVLSSSMADSEEISLLIDVGTNGEIVLGCKDWFICCSASAGPAFEGAGTACGMRASTGAIEKVSIAVDGSIILGIIGGKNRKPSGICGTGYIDLISELFTAGFLDRTGRFNRDSGLDRIREGENGVEFLLASSAESQSSKEIVVTENDIRTLIRTKGSIYTAAEAVIRHMGLSWTDVESVIISGGFGNVINTRHAIVIGLLPDLAPEKFHYIGNGSITGAKMSLMSVEALHASRAIAEQMTYFDLSTDPLYMNEFTSSLFLPHTDVEKFPSVVCRSV